MINTYEITKPLRCPKCNSRAVNFRAPSLQYYEIAGLTDDGKICVQEETVLYGDPDTDAGDFFCPNCAHTWRTSPDDVYFLNSEEFSFAATDDYEPEDFLSNVDADADVYRSIGWGTDEDYGH